MKYINFFIFVILLTLYIFFSSNIRFSTNFLDIFLSQNSIKLFDIAKKFGYSNEILISKKGFNKKSLKELNEISNKLKQLDEISEASISIEISKDMREYLVKNYFLLADFNNQKFSKNDVLEKLKEIRKKIYTSVVYEPINSYDPLGLFTMDEADNERYFKLKDYGYVLKAKTTIDTSNANESKIVYNKLNQILKNYDEIIAFAPFFYLVENSSYIKNDAQIIMLCSSILLLILYFFVLKNKKLFFNTVFTIASSILGAILLSSLLFDEINILALVFGISITTISIDYMFHYYFHNEFIKRKFITQKSVIYGFLTTFGVFIIFSFIDIELFSQLAIFSAISLFISFFLFSWLYIYLKIPPVNIKGENKKTKSLNPLYIFLISSLMLIYVYNNLSFDNNLKNLDYQNEKLIKISEKFKEGFYNNKYQSLLISAKDKETLLQRYEESALLYPGILGIGKYLYSLKKCNKRLEKIKEYNFGEVKKYLNEASKELGFNNIFKNAYPKINNLKCDMSYFDNINFKIIKNENTYYTMAFVDKKYKIKDSENIKVINLGKSLSSDTEKMKNTLIKYMLISTVFIILVLFILAKSKILYPLSYMIFPISSVLFVISLLGMINIMHIFALVILLAIGIDYGIYMYKTTNKVKTSMAIRYALLSTFSGFGVLIFSSTVALYSIGLVITVGIISVFFLLYFSL